MLLRSTIEEVLRNPLRPVVPSVEVAREVAPDLALRSSRATILTGVRLCGQSTSQQQLMRDVGSPFSCNFEDTLDPRGWCDHRCVPGVAVVVG